MTTKQKIVFSIASAGIALACLHAADIVLPSGLEDWARETNSYGAWLAASSRTVKLPNGKFQPQFLLPKSETNEAKWKALFEGDQAYDTLELAQFKTKRAWQVKKEVQDALASAFKSDPAPPPAKSATPAPVDRGTNGVVVFGVNEINHVLRVDPDWRVYVCGKWVGTVTNCQFVAATNQDYRAAALMWEAASKMWQSNSTKFERECTNAQQIARNAIAECRTAQGIASDYQRLLHECQEANSATNRTAWPLNVPLNLDMRKHTLEKP